MLTSKFFYVAVFSGTFKARMLKLCIHMDNELFYMGLRIGLLALILLFICPFFCLLMLNLCHSFSPELCKLESSNMVYIM